jgi:serine/threonine protein kinase
MIEQLRDYVVIRPLGEGGMGTVYLATEKFLLRKVAIKVLNPLLSRDSQLVERFRQEARLQSTLSHPNIVALHAFFSEQDTYYMVMEYAEGETLKSLIDRLGPISEDRALQVFHRVVEAVEYAHGKGIIHRDIKPGNIMIGDGDSVKVMDFGIAKAIGDQRLTKTGTKLGTLYYMSPEQVRAVKDVDRRTDIYSLGVTLYEMLTGSLPFDSGMESEFQVMQNIAVEGTFDSATLGKIANKAVQTIVSKMTAKERDFRCESCTDVLVAIDQVMRKQADDHTGVTVVDDESKGISPVEVTIHRKRTPRRPAFGLIVLAAMAMLAVGVVWLISRKPQEERIEPRRIEAVKKPTASNQPLRIEHYARSTPYGLSFKFSSDGRYVFLDNRWKEPTIYETSTGRIVNILTGHQDGISGTSFSPSGELVISGSKDRTARIWSVASGRQLCAVPGNSWELQSVQFSPDGSVFCAASEDKSLTLYETNTCTALGVFRGFKDRVSGVAFSPDGTLLATGSWDRHIRVWNVASRELVYDVGAHDYGVSGVCFSADGNSLFSASIDRKIKQWSLDSKVPQRVFTGHRLDVYSVVCSPTESRIASSSADQTVRIWDIRSGKQVHLLLGHTQGVKSVNYSPDGRYIVSSSWDGTAKLWNTQNGELVHTYQ